MRPGPAFSSVLVWRPTEFDGRATAPIITTACCLRSTTAGSRAVVYRASAEQGIAGIYDFVTDASPRPGGGWAADGVLHRLGSPLPRAHLLADGVLAAVFAHIQGRKGLPDEVAQRLGQLLPVGFLTPPGVAECASRLRPDRTGHVRNPQRNPLEAVMGGFMDKAKDFADQHDEQVDQGMEKAGDFADEKTGGQHGEQIDRGVDIAQERTGEGDTQP